jgi:hypothetical protein
VKNTDQNHQPKGNHKAKEEPIQLPANFEKHFDPTTRERVMKYLEGSKPAAA